LNEYAVAPLPPLCSIEDVEAIGGPIADENTDRAQRLIEMASAAVRRFCHQSFAAPVPDDLAAIVAAKVAGFVAAQGANPDGLRSLQTGAMSETYSNPAGSEGAVGPGALTEAEQNALRAAGYRRGSMSALVGPPVQPVPRPVALYWPWDWRRA
jgi:hypothetical protein